MSLISVALVAVVAAFLSAVLRPIRPEQAMAVGLAGGILILLLVLAQAVPAFETVRQLFSEAAIGGTYIAILFKALGVCLLTGLAADTCRDAGEGALASKAELAGKIAMVLLALPLFEQLMTLATSLISGKAIS
ncbi:MAG: stage III sporulation protein AD [Oscillospiraceae bacterium]|nr:stage III sporulation protein AD [Oscillospiraceae bacterium]